MRELLEETQLEVVVEEFLGWVERIGEDPDPYHFVILDFRVHVLDPEDQPVAGDDATEVRWVPLDELGRPGAGRRPRRLPRRRGRDRGRPGG